jgi:hypothetical protein
VALRKCHSRLSAAVVWGVPFVLIGPYMVLGRFLVRAIASRHTRYVLTDRRDRFVWRSASFPASGTCSAERTDGGRGPASQQVRRCCGASQRCAAFATSSRIARRSGTGRPWPDDVAID